MYNYHIEQVILRVDKPAKIGQQELSRVMSSNSGLAQDSFSWS